jgi:hypothetical protein
LDKAVSFENSNDIHYSLSAKGTNFVRRCLEQYHGVFVAATLMATPVKDCITFFFQADGTEGVLNGLV